MKKYRKIIGVVFIVVAIYMLLLVVISPSLPPEINSYAFTAAVVLIAGIIIGGIYLTAHFLSWCFD